MKTLIMLGCLLFVLPYASSRGAPPVEQSGAKESAGKDVRFCWAIGALVKAGDDLKFVPVGTRTALRTGDRFKMFLELRERCFAYVLLSQPNGEIRLLFPYTAEQVALGPDVQKGYFIPQGEGWFELDEELGVERIHLIVSKERLRKLETLLQDAESRGSTGKKEMAQRILSEIRSLERTHQDLKTYAERPIPIIGRTRGTDNPEEDLLSTAQEVSAKGFFTRTVTIDHRP